MIVNEKVKKLREKFDLNVSTSYDEMDVKYIQKNLKTRVGELVIKVMNERFIYYQLGITIQPIDKRELWYVCRNTLGGVIDLAGDPDQQYISFSNMVKGFCDELVPSMFNYWGEAQEKLVPSKEKAIIYDCNMRSTTLSFDSVERLSETPFFIVICEKQSTLEDFMNELRSRGYRRGFYGIVLGGYAVTSVIVLLNKLYEKDKFTVVTLLDFDLNGFQIYLDLSKWYPCETIGVNPFMLEYSNLSFNELKETYNPKNSDKLIVGIENMIEEVNADDETKATFMEWVKLMKTERCELNAVTAFRFQQGKPKAIDFVNYFEYILEKRVWDLNREVVPSINKPSYIEKIRREIEEKAIEAFNKFLSDMDLLYSDGWIESIPELKEKLEKYLQINSNYTGKLNEFESLISKQNKTLKTILENSSLYLEIKEKLEKIRDDVLNVISNYKTNE
jgi:hypothetical protein